MEKGNLCCFVFFISTYLKLKCVSDSKCASENVDKEDSRIKTMTKSKTKLKRKKTRTDGSKFL